MKELFYSTIVLLYFMMGSTIAKGSTLTATFDDRVGLPERWEIIGNITNNDDRGRNNSASLWSSGKSATDNYVVTEPVKGSLSFYWRSYGIANSYPKGQIFIYKYNNETLGELIWKSDTYKSSTWKLENVSLGDYEGTIAIALYSACIDDVTYTQMEVIAAPRLQVAGQESGSTFDFGDEPVPAGTTKTFTLANKGGQDLIISAISVTGSYTITDGADLTCIPALSNAKVTIATPNNDTEGVMTIVSNDADSPYSILLSSKLKVPAPKMDIQVKEIVFGTVAETITRTIEVSNIGEKELIVDISSSHADFTVNPSMLVIQPNEAKTFDVTFNYQAESTGFHSAIITATPNAGKPFEIVASAKTQDANVWREDFSSNTLPKGWEADEQNWTFSDGVAHAKYGGYSDAYRYFLTTPALTVTDENEELTFMAKSTGVYVTIKITLSKDGGDFVSYKNIDLENNMTDFATFAIGGLTPGTYVFRFANDSYDLDNFAGFKTSAKSHDAFITATVIPSKGTQFTEYEASISVKELSGKVEPVATKFFIGNQQYGETIVDTIDAYTTKTFTIKFTPEEAISGDAYFVVSNNDLSLTSPTTAVNIKKAPTLDEDNGSTADFENWSNYELVVLNYNMKKGWNTIILPFAINNLSVFGSNTTFYELTHCEENNLYFSQVNNLYPQVPYLYYSDSENNFFIFQDIECFRTNSDLDNLQVRKGNALFQGIYAPAEAGTLAGKCIATGSEKGHPQFVIGNSETNMKGFRAYMEWPYATMNIFLDGIATGIHTMAEKAPMSDNQVFNLKGMRIQSMKKAHLYIVNKADGRTQGKKILISSCCDR